MNYYLDSEQSTIIEKIYISSTPRFTNTSLVTITTRWSTLFRWVNTSTASTGVTMSFGPPTGSHSGPAYFCFAHSTLHPVTATYFHNKNLTARTSRCLFLFNHFFHISLCFFRIFIITSFPFQIFLILLTIHLWMRNSTRNTITTLTNGTVEG